MKRSLIAIAAAGALALVLAGALVDTVSQSVYSGTAAQIKSVGITAIAGVFQCNNNLDDDTDAAINDGCKAVIGSPPEKETECSEAEADCTDADGKAPWDFCDDDHDGLINDGCDAVDEAEVFVLDPPNVQYLACGNVNTSHPVTGWDGLLDDDFKLQVIPPWQPYAAIDADTTNDGGPCNSVDASAEVTIGDTNDVAICLVNVPAPVVNTSPPPAQLNGMAKWKVDLMYNPAKNSCVDKICNNIMPCTEDDMPDLNWGLTLGQGLPTFPGVTTGPEWSCNGAGFAEPSCTGGKATISCGSLNGPFPPTGPNIAFPIAVVSFTADAVGVDNLSLAKAAFWDKAGAPYGSCNPTLQGDPVLPCIGAEIDKHIEWTPTPLPPSCDLSVVKTDAPDPVTVGEDVVYTITVTNNDPVSVEALIAEDVVLVDTLPATKLFKSFSGEGCDCAEAANVVTCALGDIDVDDSVVCTITATATTAGVSTNVVDVTTDTPDANMANNHDEETTNEINPTPTPTNTPETSDVEMLKDCDTGKPGIQKSCNLWLMAPGSGCASATDKEEGKGCLVIDKWVFGARDVDSPNDSDTIAEGVGAWEEQIKYDHKIVRLATEPDNTWLEQNGRIANCSMTILTENWILTGCVTKDAVNPQTGAPLGKLGATDVDGLIETIQVNPETADLMYRQGFRPGKDNGVVTDIVDENCEVADILGERIPGTDPGGLAKKCGDVHITVRMLEADLNLDCKVDVFDDQAIAFRYGTFFGLSLYDEWYDLAPECLTAFDPILGKDVTTCTIGVPDFDIDIKDLQFVFGRNYSTCQIPIPDGQVPVAPPQP